MSRDPFERYEAKPFFGSSHTWAFKHLESIQENSVVLDIGPGSGIAGQFLKDRGVERRCAVEIDPNTREKLAPLYERITPSVEELPQEISFDCVLLLDVLEHMANPFEFLTRLEPRLAPDALVLISVPNITHLAIRLMMAFGYFEYMERGPLDRTHLQFFSRRRFHQLLRALPQSAVIETSGPIEPLELILPRYLTDNRAFHTFSRARLQLMKLWPSLLAYQHVALLKIQKD